MFIVIIYIDIFLHVIIFRGEKSEKINQYIFIITSAFEDSNIVFI